MTTRSRADAFARALDAGVPQAPNGALLTALATLRNDLDIVGSPGPQWRSALRMRLLAVAALPPVPESTRSVANAAARLHRLRVPRRVAVLAGALAFAVTLTGIGVGATRSLPGQPLYAAKRATEALQLRTAYGPLEQGSRHLQFAETRLREVSALASGRGALALPTASSRSSLLASGAGPGPIGWALADMDFQTRTGSDLVQRAARDSGSSALFLVLQEWSGEQADRLRTVVPALPGAERERAQASLSVIAAVGADATSALVSCPPGPAACPSPVGPGPKVPVGRPTGRFPLTPLPAPGPAAPSGALPGLPTPGGAGPGAGNPTGTAPGGTSPGGTIPGLAGPGVTLPAVPGVGAPTGGVPSLGTPPSQLLLTDVPTSAPPVPPTSPGAADPTGLLPTLPAPPVPTNPGAPSGVLPGP